jgi:hypothetical protein
MLKILFCAVIAVFPTVLLLTWMRTNGVLTDLFSVGVFGADAPGLLRGFVVFIYGVITLMLVAGVKLGGESRKMGSSR